MLASLYFSYFTSLFVLRNKQQKREKNVEKSNILRKMDPINVNDPQLLGFFIKLGEGASSMNAADRDQAEREIRGYQERVDQQSGFIGLLLHLSTSNLPVSTFYSIVLKNTVKLCWNPQTAEHCIQTEDKAVVRTNIIGLMLQAPSAVQRNMAEAIALIADIDFPTTWPDALTVIVNALQTATTVSVQVAAFSTAHSILQKYRLQSEMTESFVNELRTVYTILFAPLMQSMASLATVCETQQGADAVLACRGLTSAVECLRDMTSLDLGDEFLNSIEAMVSLFLRCLTLNNPALNGHDASGGSVAVRLKSTVTSCLTHLLNSFDEDFEKYAVQFLKVIWDMVADPSSAASAMDDLVIRGLELLSSACRGTTRPAFDQEEILRTLIQNVILPNLAVRDDDLELYTDEPEAYIQKDIEGSDFHTRRRAAGDLVRTLVTTLPEKTRPLLSNETDRLFAAAGADWKAKDTAIYLASSLALDGLHIDTQRGAATQQLSDLISFDGFLKNVVLPELTSGISQNSPSIVKADCIRVVALFRTHLDTAMLPTLLPMLGNWVGNEEVVVMSYAAHALERLLMVQRDREYVVTESMVQPHAGAILQTLCVRVQGMEQPNPYLIQCLMRICFRFPTAVGPYVGDIVLSMNGVLTSASRNPSNPVFSHCLFETLSKCISAQPQKGAMMEELLWGNLIYVLANDVLEYVPYVLQIMAQLLRTHQPAGPAPPAHYQSLLEPLTQSSMYEQRGNIPAVVSLLCAFIELYPSYVHSQGHTNKILNIFSFLVRLKNYDHEGLNIVTAMMLSYPPEVMGTYFNAVLQVLLDRLNRAKTPKYVRILILFFSVTVAVRGADDLVSRMNSIQPGLFMMVLDRVWLPHMQKITGTLERKVCIVALAKLLCDCAELQSDQAAWTTSVYSCLKMIHTGAEQDDYTSFSPQTATLQELAKLQDSSAVDAAFSNVFCPLQDATPKPVDVCADIHDPDQYFRNHMMQLLRGPGAHLVEALQKALTPDLLALIQ